MAPANPSHTARPGLFSFALGSLVRHYVDETNLARATDVARSWLSLDPWHEPAHRALMEIHALAGNRPAALRQYEAVRGPATRAGGGFSFRGNRAAARSYTVGRGFPFVLLGCALALVAPFCVGTQVRPGAIVVECSHVAQ